MIDVTENPVPMAEIIGFAPDGAPYLHGLRCSSCGVVSPGRRLACPSCLATSGLEPAKLGNRGTIFAFTIVHRSFPGVPVPLISAVVRLDSGAHVRGNIEGLAPQPDAVLACAKVEVEFDTITADDGTPLIRYVFRPADGAAL
jgi:uncharacterized OB-fold protein